MPSPNRNQCRYCLARGRWSGRRTCRACRHALRHMATAHASERRNAASAGPPAGHEERIARYAARAAAGLPLFDG